MKHRLPNKFPELDEKGYGTSFYGWDGKPVTLGQWVTMTEGRTQVVGQRHLTFRGETYRVSTVLLGLDYSFGRDETPVIFETMVWGPDIVDVIERYKTLQQARKGHRRTVAYFRDMFERQRALRAGMIHNGRRGRKP